VIAARVEQRSAADDVDLQGPVQAVSNPNLTILGAPVVSTAAVYDLRMSASNMAECGGGIWPVVRKDDRGGNV